jgi:galactonate dehydratase
MTAGMAGLLVAEQASAKSQVFNPAKALASPADDIKITKLEIIPVHSCLTIFVKIHTNAGIVGIGEGTVEGRIPTTMAAIQELEIPDWKGPQTTGTPLASNGIGRGNV